jgi:2-oxoglutarate ferredoxin oxidoreductase subunit delta
MVVLGTLVALNMGEIRIDPRYCKGCDICIQYCPMKVFEKSEEPNERGRYLPIARHKEKCTALRLTALCNRRVCGLCEDLCPDQAITIEV